MSIPRKVKLGAVDIAVIPIKHLEAASENLGSANFPPAVVYFDPDAEPATTIIHELIHHVLWRRGSPQARDEELVTQMENTIAALIRDNPAMCRWLVDQIAGVARGGKQGKSSKRKRK